MQATYPTKTADQATEESTLPPQWFRLQRRPNKDVLEWNLGRVVMQMTQDYDLAIAHGKNLIWTLRDWRRIDLPQTVIFRIGRRQIRKQWKTHRLKAIAEELRQAGFQI